MKRGNVSLTGLLEKHLWLLGIPLNKGVVRHGALVSSGPEVMIS